MMIANPVCGPEVLEETLAVTLTYARNAIEHQIWDHIGSARLGSGAAQEGRIMTVVYTYLEGVGFFISETAINPPQASFVGQLV